MPLIYIIYIVRPRSLTFTSNHARIHSSGTLSFTSHFKIQLATANAFSSISIKLFLLLRFPLRKSTGNDKRVSGDVTADDEQGIDRSRVIVKTSLMGDGNDDDVGEVLGDDKLDRVDVVVLEQLLLSLHRRRSSSSDVDDSDTSIRRDGSPSDAVLLNSQVAPSSLSSPSDELLLLLLVDFKTPAAFKVCSSSRSCPMKFKFGEIIGRFCFTTLYASNNESDWYFIT